MLGDDIAQALPELRAHAESMMTDTCEIREPDSWAGEIRQQGATAWTYQGKSQIPCRVKKSGEVQPRAAGVGGESVITVTLTVSVPITVCPVEGQVITMLGSIYDPSLVGRRFDVVAAGVGSQITARRLSCIEHDDRV